MCSLENVNDQAWKAFSDSQLKRCSRKAPKNRASAAMIFTGMAISRLDQKCQDRRMSVLAIGKRRLAALRTTPNNMAGGLASMSHQNLGLKPSRVLLLLCFLLFSIGCVTQQASNRSSPLSGAQASLDEARRTQSESEHGLGPLSGCSL